MTRFLCVLRRAGGAMPVSRTVGRPLCAETEAAGRVTTRLSWAHRARMLALASAAHTRWGARYRSQDACDSRRAARALVKP